VIVADASVVVDFIAGTERGHEATSYLTKAGAIYAPALVDAEAAQAIRGLVLRGQIDEPRGRAAIEILGELPLIRVPITGLLPRVWQLRSGLTAYDACYVALAESLECPLLTFDSRIAGADGHTAEVITPGR
jgi:predicted nucleic acid-binding protein